MRYACAVVMAAAGGAASVAAGQQSFALVRDMAGIVEPPVGTFPINAGQVITGVAQRYLIQRDPDAQHARSWIAALPAAPGGGAATELAPPSGALWAGVVAASDDGVRVLGRLSYANGTVRACIWDGTTPAVWAVGANASQEPVALSADGTRMLLRTGQVPSVQTRVVSASQTLLLTDPSEDTPQQVYGQALSPSGELAAGRYDFGQVFQWSAANGTTLDQPPFAGRFEAAAVSDTGRFTFLTYNDNLDLYDAATRADGMWRSIPGFGPLCQRRDGAQIGGFVKVGTGPFVERRAAVWSQTTGLEDLRAALEARGIDIHGWTLWELKYISPDGRKLVGRGRPSEGAEFGWWVATISPWAAADIGRAGGVGGSDGQLDNNDFIVFIDRFFAQDERVDVGKTGGERGGDGVFDNNDFTAFIGLFFGGEP